MADDKPSTMGQYMQQRYMPHTVEQSLSAAQDAATTLPEDVSPTFKKADAFTALHEGGITRNDGNQGTAAFGIDQKAHPNIDVTKLTADQAQAMRYEYWRSIGGEEIAKKNPALAEAAYDTAIMSGPDRSQQFLKGADGDANKFLNEREQFFHRLESHPAYSGAAKGWEARNQDLRAEIKRNDTGHDQMAMAPPRPQQQAPKRRTADRRNPAIRLRNQFT